MKASWTLEYKEVEAQVSEMFLGKVTAVRTIHVIAEDVTEAASMGKNPEIGWFLSGVYFDHWIDHVEEIGGLPAVQVLGEGRVRRR